MWYRTRKQETNMQQAPLSNSNGGSERTTDRIVVVIMAVALIEYIRITISITALERMVERLSRELDRLYGQMARREVARETLREVSLYFGGATTQTTSGGFPKMGTREE